MHLLLFMFFVTKALTTALEPRAMPATGQVHAYTGINDDSNLPYTPSPAKDPNEPFSPPGLHTDTSLGNQHILRRAAYGNEGLYHGGARKQSPAQYTQHMKYLEHQRPMPEGRDPMQWAHEEALLGANLAPHEFLSRYLAYKPKALPKSEQLSPSRESSEGSLIRTGSKGSLSSVESDLERSKLSRLP